MEDALVQSIFFDKDALVERLNPCFNGRCTRTGVILSSKLKNKLS